MWKTLVILCLCVDWISGLPVFFEDEDFSKLVSVEENDGVKVPIKALVNETITTSINTTDLTTPDVDEPVTKLLERTFTDLHPKLAIPLAHKILEIEIVDNITTISTTENSEDVTLETTTEFPEEEETETTVLVSETTTTKGTTSKPPSTTTPKKSEIEKEIEDEEKVIEEEVKHIEAEVEAEPVILTQGV